MINIHGIQEKLIRVNVKTGIRQGDTIPLSLLVEKWKNGKHGNIVIQVRHIRTYYTPCSILASLDLLY